MQDGLRSRKMVYYGTMLLLSWSLMPMGLPVAYSQPAPEQAAPVEPVPTEPIPSQQPPATAPTEAERAKETERVKQAEPTKAAEPETKFERKLVRPSETYVGGFGGYTFGGNLTDVSVGGPGLPDFNLADSVVYGGKVGHFFGDRLDWLGLEMEAYNTTPHLEQQGAIPGSHLRVTTLAFNVVGRLKFGCETKTERTERRTERDAKMDREIRYETLYEREFCRLQPYGGVGLGVFFANLSNIFGSTLSGSDNAVPGFNGLAGLRYFVTERIALFGEYKYNFAPFDFTVNGPFGGAVGVKADYHINHFVGGLSLHF